MSIIDGIRSLPEVTGVRLYRMPPHAPWQETGGLTVRIVWLHGTGGPASRHEGYTVTLMPAPLDAAHDLSWQGPEAYVWPAAWVDGGGVTLWSIDVAGFTEAEALDAYYAVRAAIGSVYTGAPGE